MRTNDQKLLLDDTIHLIDRCGQAFDILDKSCTGIRIANFFKRWQILKKSSINVDKYSSSDRNAPNDTLLKHLLYAIHSRT